MPAAERVAASEREIFAAIDQTRQMLIFQRALNCIFILTSHFSEFPSWRPSFFPNFFPSFSLITFKLMK